jgi:hypothetical protein
MLKKRLLRGSSWAFGERLGGDVIGLITSGLLERMLSAFYRRSPASGVRLRTYRGRCGDGRSHRTAKRDHCADRQEDGRDVDPRELLPRVVPEGPLEPVSDPRSSTEDGSQEVRLGETLG